MKSAKKSLERAQSIDDFYRGDYNLESEIKAATFYMEKVQSFLRKIAPSLSASLGRKPLLLDVGCDNGVFSSAIARSGFDVYGIDIRVPMVLEARKRGIKAVAHNVEKKFPFKDAMFDVVFAGEIIEHLFDTDFFVHELSRVVKPGGIVVITTPNMASLSNRFRLLFGKLPVGNEIRLGRDSAGHIRNYTFPELKRQMREHGFAIKMAVSANIMFPVMWPLPRFLKVIAMRLGDFFPNIGSHIIIGAVKKA